MDGYDAFEIIEDSLIEGWRTLELLGEDAKKIHGKQVDIATRGDEIVGDTIIEHLKKLDMPLVIYTEEKGKVEIGSGAKYSVIFDDIDGTLNFKEGMGMLPHGTIMGIFEGPDPTFEDCIASGFLEYNSGNLFGARRDHGAFFTEPVVKKGQPVEHKLIKRKWKMMTSGRTSMEGDKPARIVPDLYMLGSLAPHIAKYSGSGNWLGDFRCKALHMVQVADGMSDIFVFANNCYNPKKLATAEELAPGYLMVVEAGGVVRDWYGRNIGVTKVGLGEKKTYDIVVAATSSLANEFLQDVRKSPKIRSYLEKRSV